MESQIRCKVYPGQFSNEYAIEGVDAADKVFSLFAPVTAVETAEPPTRERTVSGWLKVVIWEQRGDKVIVKLPRESFESGRYVTVNVSDFKVRPEAIGA